MKIKQKITSWLFIVVTLTGLAAGCNKKGIGTQNIQNQSGSLTASLQLITEGGGRLDWDSKTKRIAYDKADQNHKYDIYTMSQDGSNKICLTCGKSGLPTKTIGQPAWHPSGSLLVVQAEKDKHPPTLNWIATSPGVGVYNDLWVVDAVTGKGKLLHEIPLGRNYGTLHPHFSLDGTKISWTEMFEAASLGDKLKKYGLWKLKVADFNLRTQTISNIKEYEPLGHGFYENHGFSPDGTKLIFTSNAKREENDIFTFSLADGVVAQLTDTGYNEHAHFSPNGQLIAWMHGKSLAAGTEFWVMNSDGSGKSQLTNFNTKGAAEYQNGNLVTASDLSWGATSNSFVGYVQVGNITKDDYKELIYLISNIK